MKKIKLFIFVIIILLIPNVSLGYDGLNSDVITNIRINEIRKTSNTDFSKRTGKVYYVATNGDDSNDGLTPDTAWKTIDKVNSDFEKRKIKSTDTVLFRRGDIFRGHIIVRVDDIMIGCYGDESLPKPEILVSQWNGAEVGEWKEIDTNIWEYTVDDKNPFVDDVGVIWFYSNNGRRYFGQKIITLEDFDESNLDLKELLNNDLEFYQLGHSYSSASRSNKLYVYSEENPKYRFSEIEFAIAKSGIRIWNLTNIIVDNLDVKYAGIHGISAGTVSNLEVTNCEFSCIGGVTQKYENNKFVRYGNAIEVYGSVTEKNGYPVEKGYIVRNNYVHDIYDAGITFQLTTEDASPVENVIFDNNVIEYCVYNIEYWNNCTSKDEEVQANTYINNFEITNNIMRYAGVGVSQTRPDKNQSAHIKTWKHNQDNLVTGRYIIENNIFDNSAEHVFYIFAVNEKSLPIIKNNTFYNSLDVPFGYLYFDKKIIINYNIDDLKELLPENDFYDLSTNILRGDIDQDGRVTINDLANIKLYLIGKKSLINRVVVFADTDEDGKISINDLAKLKLLIIGK